MSTPVRQITLMTPKVMKMKMKKVVTPSATEVVKKLFMTPISASISKRKGSKKCVSCIEYNTRSKRNNF